MRGLPARIATAGVCLTVLTSCASVSVDDLPQPGNSYRDGYPVTLEFANVLNLPDRAKVVMDGTTVGMVESVEIEQPAVDVTVRIDNAVQVPADAHAVLRQATVLGDIYVAIERSPEEVEGGPVIASGGRIPVTQTTSPPQLEDTIANLSHFVASGSIQRVQNSIIRINNVTPEDSERVRALASRVSTDLKDLSDNVGTVDLWLDGVAGTAQSIAVHTPKLDYWFSPEGIVHWDRISITGTAIGTMVPSVGSIYTGGYWLVPMLDSLGIAVGAVQKSKWAVEGEYRPWRELFQETFLPADKYPAMNIVSVETSQGRDITNNVQDVLRMLGAIP